MDWAPAMGYGAIRGLLVEAVVTSGRILAWNAACHNVLDDAGAQRPSLLKYIDPWPDVVAAVTRLLLGMTAGWLFHTQITGTYAAVAVGCSAPALLRQLRTTQLPGGEQQTGTPEPPAGAHALERPSDGRPASREEVAS